MTTGRTIQIYVPSGDARSMRIAEITTRIVRAFEVPRVQLKEFQARPEAAQVGVYLLFGEDGNGLQLAYIGQSGAVGSRLGQHHEKKEFWTKAIAAVSLTNNWTQTHVTYLEWLCIQEASAIDRYQLDNGNSGAKPYTPEALEADCQEVFDTLRILLTTLGYPIFERLIEKSSDPSHALMTYRCAGAGGADAKGQYTAEGFVVLKGSSARKELVPSMQGNESFISKRQALIAAGKLKEEGDVLIFAEDVLFTSPSLASGMVTGRSSNGWVNAQGRTLDSIERKPKLA